MEGLSLRLSGCPEEARSCRPGNGCQAQHDKQRPTPYSGHMKKSEALKVLGLSEGASDDEVKKAHREKVRANHPDRFTDPAEKQVAEDKTKLINEARDVLLSRKWDPEYGPRSGGYGNPYNNPYTTYRPADSSWPGGFGWTGWAGTPGPGTASGTGPAGGSGAGNWQPGQGGRVEWGGMPPFWVWTTYTSEGASETGSGSAGFDPFEVIFGQTPRKSAAELAAEAKKRLGMDALVLAGKTVMLALCAVTGNLAVGMFTYAVVTALYSFLRSNSGCSALFLIPLIIVFGPIIALLTPRLGVQVTGGSLLLFAFALYWDFKTIRQDAARYKTLNAKAKAEHA